MIVETKELYNVKVDPLRLPAPWDLILGNIPKQEQWNCMIFGYSQSGKSSFCLKLAEMLSRFSGAVLYNAAEEKINTGTILERLKRMRISSYAAIDFFQNTEISQLENILSQGKYKHVIIDSVNRLAITNREILNVFEMKKKFPDVGFIFIVHGDKEQKNYLGSAALQNMVDIAIEIRQGEIIIKKNYYAKQAGNTTGVNVFKNLIR